MKRIGITGMIGRFISGFFGLVILGMAIAAGIGMWADQVTAARP